MSYEYIVYLLVFAATLAIVMVLWTTARAAGMAESAKLDFENLTEKDGRQKTQLERFVSPGTLFRLQLASGLLPGFAVPAAFAAFGFVQPFFLLAMGAIFGYGGWRIPRIYYNFRVARRTADFESRVLDLTAGLSSALKAGMALPQALERLTERMTGTMREELLIVRRDYELRVPLDRALERLAERMPCEDMQLLASAVKLTTQTGGSLSEVLEEMVEMIRGRTEFKEKLKTLTTQGRFEGLVLSLAPVFSLFLFSLIQPDFMEPLFTTVHGWCAIAAAGVFEVIGFVTIKRITSIEV